MSHTNQGGNKELPKDKTRALTFKHDDCGLSVRLKCPNTTVTVAAVKTNKQNEDDSKQFKMILANPGKGVCTQLQSKQMDHKKNQVLHLAHTEATRTKEQSLS